MLAQVGEDFRPQLLVGFSLHVSFCCGFDFIFLVDQFFHGYCGLSKLLLGSFMLSQLCFCFGSSRILQNAITQESQRERGGGSNPDRAAFFCGALSLDAGRNQVDVDGCFAIATKTEANQFTHHVRLFGDQFRIDTFSDHDVAHGVEELDRKTKFFFEKFFGVRKIGTTTSKDHAARSIAAVIAAIVIGRASNFGRKTCKSIAYDCSQCRNRLIEVRCMATT